MNKIQEIFNFNNIGGKIKGFAKWFCWITILLIWIVALINFIRFLSDEYTAKLCWIPLASAVVGPFVVWIGSWTMYAFGEYVEDVHAIRQQITKINSIDQKLQVIAQPMLDKVEEKTKRQAEVIAKLEEEKAKRQAEAIAKCEAEKKAEQIAQKKEKTLSEKLAYALMFQSDEGMISYLKGIQDESVQSILQLPQHLIREQIKKLLENV